MNVKYLKPQPLLWQSREFVQLLLGIYFFPTKIDLDKPQTKASTIKLEKTVNIICEFNLQDNPYFCTGQPGFNLEAAVFQVSRVLIILKNVLSCSKGLMTQVNHYLSQL